ncbi:MAG: hypothetical protein ACAH59_01510 [Pseudobdellovibrionaceae bacterium]
MEKLNDRLQDRIGWIRELVKAEEQMEESGLVDMGSGTDTDRLLVQESLNYLQQLKTEFIEAATAFNELKASPLGRIKIYGIAKTHADFMLFRNGFKMIFALKAPGQISIRFNFIGPNYMPSQIPSVSNTAAPMMEEHVLEAKFGPFNELTWTFEGQTVRSQAVVKHHMTLFIKESAK